MTLLNPLSIMAGNPKKIIVYSHDAYGLGNIRRMLAICQHLLKSIPHLSILLLSGSPMVQSFRLPVGLDYIKLPCLNRGDGGKMAAKYLNADIESILKLRSELILAITRNYQPDLILVDKKPSGIKGELNSTINYCQSNLPTTKFVLLLRDILDTPEKTIQEWQQENYYQQVEAVYDRLLVVGMPKIFDLAKEYQFSKTISKGVHYCGYIRKESGLTSRYTIRQKLGIGSTEKLVLVTPGGGEDGHSLINNYLQGLAQERELFQEQKIHSLIFCGAEMPQQQQQDIYQQAVKYPGVTVLEFTNDMMSYINSADMVVSMCGYNTITEVLQNNKKAIVVPRIKPGKEQLIRAQRFAQAGLIEMIHPEQLNPNLLMETLFKSLNRLDNVDNLLKLDFEGLPKVTNYLAMLLFQSCQFFRTESITLKSA